MILYSIATVWVYIIQSTIFRHCAWQIHTCCVHLLCTINFLCLILRNLQIVQCVTQCCRSGSEFFHPGSRVKKVLDFWSGFSPKWLFLSSRKYDPGQSSRIRILIFYPSRIQGSKSHRITEPDPQHWCNFKSNIRRRQGMVNKCNKKQKQKPNWPVNSLLKIKGSWVFLA